MNPSEPDRQEQAAAAAETPRSRSYTVIARRYRPRAFQEVVGQEATADTLRQAIASERLAHAYLFCGPRGVGKTSMARIFARALECTAAKGGEPCDRCDSCARIHRGEDMDVVELDGASHRGIDDVRELIQHARYIPNAGRWRIFIIDEVHMLTREAFNALLKTLEEPPEHVKFVLCTTEPEKLPGTVVSRCQRCDFAAISNVDIVHRLQQICEQEGATPETGLLERVADLARGGMRDSQSLLDQLLCFAGLSPRLADLDRLTGRLAPAMLEALIDLVERGDRPALLAQLATLEQSGTDPSVILEQIMDALRGRLRAGIAAGWKDRQIERCLLAQEILQEARQRMRQYGRADLILELALLRITTLADLISLHEALASASAEPESTPPSAVSRAERGHAGPDLFGGAGGAAGRSLARAPAEPRRPSAPGTSDPIPAASGSGAAIGAHAVHAPEAAAATRAAAQLAQPVQIVESDLVRARRCLEQTAAMVARAAADTLSFSDDGGTLSVPLAGVFLRQMDAEKREALRVELAREFGRAIRVEVIADTAPRSAEPPKAAEGRAGSTNSGARSAETGAVPPIVEKAREIFRGTVHPAGASRPAPKSGN